MAIDTINNADPEGSPGQKSTENSAADNAHPQTSETPETQSNKKVRLADTINKSQARTAYSAIVLAGMARLGELLIIGACGILVYVYYVLPASGIITAYYYAIPAIAVAAILVFQSFKLYHMAAFRSPIATVLKLTGGWALVFLGAMAAIFFMKRGIEFSRVWLFSWFVTGLIALVANRLFMYLVVRTLTRRGRLDRRAAIVGGGPAAEQLLQELTKQKNTDIKIYGTFDDRSDFRSGDVIAGFPKLGTVDDLVEFSRRTRLDLIIFSLPITAERRILQMLKKLWVLPIDIRLAAHSNKLRFRPRSYSYIGNIPLLALFDKPMADWDVVMKMAFDRIVGAICLLLFLPVMALVALAVKLDSSGPILFKQKRHGFNNKEVEVFKFRSMYADKLDYEVKQQVTRDDPRVTRVGRFIRKTSLDELPQLFNVVIKGDLSLVGPRPHAVQAMAADRLYDEVVDGYFARHRVRPGMTGWAQVNGWRGETDTPEKLQQRVEHDLYYIENWSLIFDLYILAITPFALTKTENAY